jgi:chemotaxis response regulator CheB
MRILIVDNSGQIVKRLVELVAESECISSVCTAITYNEGLHLFKEYAPDVVVIGMSEPIFNSLNFIEDVSMINTATTVIVLSLNINTLVRDQCDRLGVHYFFDKYFEFQKLPAVLNAIDAARWKNNPVTDNLKNPI